MSAEERQQQHDDLAAALDVQIDEKLAAIINDFGALIRLLKAERVSRMRVHLIQTAKNDDVLGRMD